MSRQVRMCDDEDEEIDMDLDVNVEEQPDRDPLAIDREASERVREMSGIDGRRRFVRRLHMERRIVSVARQQRTEEAAELGYVVDRVEREDILEAFGRACVYCGAKNGRLVLDHVHAIALGGRHERGNLAPACRPCNSRKSAMSLEDWIAQHATGFGGELWKRLDAGWAPRGSRGKG